MDTPTTQQIDDVVTPMNLTKVALAWAISLLFLFVVVFVISRAWKKGQSTGIVK